ncbi:hypothetical protein M3Y97_00948000 [Aphelenchoides bicaudatus]|nr:hypothetical protein M3Y97_00948000 [Aphelenchoides bicaudatus]
MKDEKPDWCYTDPPTRQLKKNEKDNYKLTFYPRTFPYNFFVQTDGEVHKMEPTEYLIGYYNELTAIGVAKHVERIPAVNHAIWNTRRANRLFANTLAVEWTIIHKPKLVRALGYVLDFEAVKRKDNHVHFTGEVCDQESNLRVKVVNDQWPTYIRKQVEVESAIVITWIDIDEPHAICKNNIVNGTVFPSGSSTKLNLKYAEEIDSGQYWLGWVDTSFKASRNG